MGQDTQNRVAAAVWHWRDREKIRAAGENSSRRRKVLNQAAVALALGAGMLLLARYSSNHARFFDRAGTIASCVGSLILIIGLTAPRLYDGIDRAVAYTARVFGQGLNWILLTPFFYLCFLPARLSLMVRGKDPMTRKCPSGETTYWVPRPARRPDHFTRQH